jgi:flagellar hook-basal body complex protein FliE
MKVNILSSLPSSLAPTSSAASTTAANPFRQVLDGALEAQMQADDATMRLANGENIDIHTVTMATQKAQLMLELVVEMRNKIVESYQELMRMQV